MNNSKKLCSATLVFVILSLLLSCSHETKSIQPVDVDTVLSWQIPAETMPELKKLPILSGHSVHVSETTLEDAARTFMENANLPNTDNTHDTGTYPDSYFSATWSDHSYRAGKDGAASFSIDMDGEGNSVSFSLSFSTFENSCIRQTFILPDKETIPSHVYTSDRFQQGMDLDFLSCEDAKTKTKEFLRNLGLPVDNLEFTIYTIDLETLQTVADDMYAAGRFELIPPSTTPSGQVKEGTTMMYKQYAKEDECYYIIVRFTYEGIPLYDDQVGLSDGTSSATMGKMDGENPPFTMIGPVCHLLLEQDGFTYAQIGTGAYLNFEAEGTPKTVLTFQEAREALASLYAGKVIVKPDSVQKLELCYIPIYHEESKNFTLVPAWHAELYTYPDQEEQPDHIRVEQVFLDAYDGHQLYPPEEVPTDAAP
ncbi:MAG: hypothetical protein ACLSV7_04590 [Oscillospiraceae bacterium]